MKLSRFALPACLAILLTACASPAWYFQATSGHLDLMRSRQPVSDYLEDAGPDDPLAERLSVVDDMLRFAQADLGLDAGDSYRSIAVTGREAVVWNVVSTPEFSLQPKRYCFLVAGCVPYRGYFEPAAAHREAERLRRNGLDVAVAPALAYSSLGWFDDPLLDTMLSLPDAFLAGTLFHELAHQRLYVKGDTDFNESYATFLEREGVRAWLTVQGDEAALLDWRQRMHASRQFNSILRATRNGLADLYASGRPEAEMRHSKQQLFELLRDTHDLMAEHNWRGKAWFASWFDPPPNNARLALLSSYVAHQCAFRRLFESSDGDFHRFNERAASIAELPAHERAAWLATPC